MLRYSLLIVFIVIAGFSFVALIDQLITPQKIEHNRTEEILIKKVEIIPRTFLGMNSASIKITLEKPIQCEGHATTVLYNNFVGGDYDSLLLPMAYPEKTFYLRSFFTVAWDKCDRICILKNGISVESVQSAVKAKTGKTGKAGEVGLKPAFKFIF